MIFFRDYYYYNSNINWPDSSVYFWGPYDAQVQAIGVAAENNVQHELPIGVTVIGAEVRNSVSGVLATAEESNFELYIDSGSSVELLAQMDMTAIYNDASNHALSIDLPEGTTFSIRATNPAWATNPTNMFGMTVRLYFDTGNDDNYYLKVFRTGAALTPPSRAEYYFNGSGHTTYQTTEKFYWQSPYNGTIQHAALCIRGAGTSTELITTAVMINGVRNDIDASLRARSGSNRVMVKNIGLDFVAGDTITVAQFMPSSWSGTPPSQICIVNDLIIQKTSN